MSPYHLRPAKILQKNREEKKWMIMHPTAVILCTLLNGRIDVSKSVRENLFKT